MTSFNKLFWGFILVPIDFRIQGFDIFPDIVGYIFILLALSRLSDKSSYFQSAKAFAIPLTVLSLFDLVQFSFGHQMMLILSLFGIITVILNLYMVFHICMGIAEMAVEIGEQQLENAAKGRWTFYLCFNLFFTAVMILTLMVPPIISILFIPSFIAMIVLTVVMARLMKQADRMIPEYR